MTAMGALWLDGTFWFQTGAGTKKHHNVERDPRCSIAVSVLGADVVVDGDARMTESRVEPSSALPALVREQQLGERFEGDHELVEFVRIEAFVRSRCEVVGERLHALFDRATGFRRRRSWMSATPARGSLVYPSAATQKARTAATSAASRKS